MRSTAFLASQSTGHDHVRNGQQALQVQPLLPLDSQTRCATHGHALSPLSERLQTLLRRGEAGGMAYQSGLLPHERLECIPEHIHVLTPGAFAERQRPRKVCLDLGCPQSAAAPGPLVCHSALKVYVTAQTIEMLTIGCSPYHVNAHKCLKGLCTTICRQKSLPIGVQSGIVERLPQYVQDIQQAINVSLRYVAEERVHGSCKKSVDRDSNV